MRPDPSQASDTTEARFSPGWFNEMTPEIASALALLETAVTNRAYENFKDEFREDNLNETFMFMAYAPEPGTSPLDVTLYFENEVMATLNIRTELLEVFDEPRHQAAQIAATVKDLRLLADELEALPWDDE